MARVVREPPAAAAGAAPHSKQQRPATAPAARAASSPPRGRDGAHSPGRRSPSRPAWVSAEWKHLVPASPERDCGASGGAAGTGARRADDSAFLRKQRQRQISSGQALVDDLMESILDRCERIQQHCAPRAPPPARGAAGARPGTAPAAARARWGSRAGAGGGGGTRVTMRSGLLFASPQHVTWDTGAVGEQQGPEMLGACDSWRRTPGPAALASGGEPAAAAPAISPGPAAASPPAPAAATSAPWPAPWAGAVDLNPGFGFAPGSPQRVAAVAPALPGVLARMEQLQGEVRRLDLGRMTHREVLQASIAQLNTEFCAALRDARQQANGLA